jgi:hypothetical protein
MIAGTGTSAILTPTPFKMPGVATPSARIVDTSKGALIISLDFELHWGVFDSRPVDGSYRQNLLGARDAVSRMLETFEEHGVAATWATVGLLFARSKEEADRFSPELRPSYQDRRLSAYEVAVGADEAEDPLHYASSLVGSIIAAPRQELATHTFSHYYCLEAGQTEAEFTADLDAARRIALQYGVEVQSIVFPRNQHNPAYDEALRKSGIVAYRGNARGRLYRPSARFGETRSQRLLRGLDAIVPLSGSLDFSWADIAKQEAPRDVPASLFLRPASGRSWLDALTLRRILGAVRGAAQRNRVVHIWWHPHNFGIRLKSNLERLQAVLATFAECRERFGMQSLTMAEAATAMNSAPELRDLS